MRLKFTGACGYCSEEELTVTLPELTEKDCEYYEEIGWANYQDTEVKLPELGNPMYFYKGSLSPGRGIVIEIKGKRYKVTFGEDCDEEPWESNYKYIDLEPTEEPLSVPDRVIDERREWRGGYDYKFFGQPTWVQGPHYPKDKRGNPYYNLVTIENGWGDSGNYNILISLDENGEPDAAYFEASCC